MPETITDILIYALENISKESLKNFKRKLSSFNVQSPYKKIPSSTLDDQSAKEVVDSIVRYYTTSDGADITEKVLWEINERQISQDLNKNIASAKRVQVEKTPGKGLADKLRDRTNRTSSRTRFRQHQRQKYGQENLLNSEESSHSETEPTQPRNVRRLLNMSGAENKGRRSSTPRHLGRQCQPDIQLVDLTDTDIELMVKNHEKKVETFARYVFQHLVPFDIYQSWVKNTNFDGCRGKVALPGNLRDAIVMEVGKEFTLNKENKRKIKNTINELLRNQRRGGWPILI
ncbi:uncharacterized protein LOC122944503 [Bufo gargarizans]|uniref:uncharacterized protein LOC122944503 n=1 Tax=Bufo gargarizans TaxID=30331 RepID=UPI001CF116D1|nr:uncharacterized protein LOC122944503 [Bufo gargarizans]XP_044158786.1 uncharacterized protein LOC122944503 [Bufo gargarizans]XP_044158787.1 uncharacterized protein LOC122944503 [Bufo gargarizans]XP_044158788.1 uncharacterized protein LOC122944503 [Bufo gargarizans]XP_044158790.1 uncharacterized protein LOC122944503 [Bufo gargarizans]XP_044158791.1 uncharacterized protein LOC122944503 [Bufo gargarizans]